MLACLLPWAISNRRLVAFSETGIAFRYQDCKRDGPESQRVTTIRPAAIGGGARCCGKRSKASITITWMRGMLRSR